MDAATVTKLCDELCTNAGLAIPDRQPIRTWALSAVERLVFPDGSAAVFKYAAEPFTHEDHALRAAAERDVPVPVLYASAMLDGTLGMVMEDLGVPLRDAGDADGATAAAVLHRTAPVEGLPVLDETALSDLPDRALRHLDTLTTTGRWNDVADIVGMVRALSRAAADRAAGAQTEPFGLVHSEFHPTSLHVGPHGWCLLDFARAFTGPGLLDLASWHGTIADPDPARLRDFIDTYLGAGGPKQAVARRGGLPAEEWALGWHRVWAVEWFLDQAVRWIADPTSDPDYIQAVRRHLTEAVAFLAV